MLRGHLRRTCAVLVKEFVHIIRDRRTLAVAVSMPILLLVLYGYALNLDVKDIDTVVLDQDRSSRSRDLVGAFVNSGYFRVVSYLQAPEQMDRAVDSGQAKVGISIPYDFSEQLRRGRAVQVQVVVDASDSLVANTIIGYVGGITSSYSNQVMLRALRRVGGVQAARPPLDPRVRVWYNPELRSSDFIVPGLIATILAMLSALLTSLTVVRERERGTMEQLVVSPVTSAELMIGKLIPYVALALLDVALIVLVGVALFAVPLRGSVLLLGLLSFLFVVASLALGLLISSLSGTQQVAMTTALFATMLPTILLSGFIFPINSMPRFFQIATNIIPARHFLVIVRGIFLKGIGLSVLWPQALALLLFAALFVALAALAFRKRL